MIFDKAFVELLPNVAGRDFAVGDAHGQGRMLERLLDLVRFDPSRDRLIALGDLIDHGTDGAALIDRVLRDSAWVSLLGNHEAMMRASAYDHDADRAWRRNGNDWSRLLSMDELDHLRDVTKGFPLAIELPLPDGRRVGLLHAEVPIRRSWQSLRGVEFADSAAIDDGGYTDAGSVLWGRRRVIADARMRESPDMAVGSALVQVHTWQATQLIPGIDLVVSGHTPLRPPLPRARANVLWIDTGAYKPEGRLTLLELTAERLWQVGHGEDQTWGPLPWPELEAPLESWRPTPEMEALAASDDARQQERLRMFFP